MRDAGLAELALYPEGRACEAPTTARVIEIFEPLCAHELVENGEAPQALRPGALEAPPPDARPALWTGGCLSCGSDHTVVSREISIGRCAERKANHQLHPNNDHGGSTGARAPTVILRHTTL